MPDVATDIGVLCLNADDVSAPTRALAPGVSWDRFYPNYERFMGEHPEEIKESWGEVSVWLDALQATIEPLYDRLGTRWHPWRKCPIDRIWTLSEGSSSLAVGQCRWDTSKKDRLFPDEIHAIAATHFGGVTGGPAAGKLPEFKDADKYDKLIRGWTKYWNDVFLGDALTDSPAEEPLDPNLVKALMASESSFDPDPSHHQLPNGEWVLGILQLTESTVRILKDQRGELKDQYIILELNDLLDPGLSICAAVRWLYQKHKLATHELKRTADWLEAVACYKGELRRLLATPAIYPPLTQKVVEFYEILTHR
jgi:hypothetical protein